MAVASQSVFKARKTPVQARSTVTVEAIAEATVQVLLHSGPERLTTTRVAERAGVSVGTLYQYYPNKQSLLFAVLQAHLDKVGAALEEVCRVARNQPLGEMVQRVVEAFVDAKMERPDISVALYQIAAGVGGDSLVDRNRRRWQKALEEVLGTATDASFGDLSFAVRMMIAAMAGTTRAVLEAGASAATVKHLRKHLVVLCQAYLAAVTDCSVG